MGKDIVLDLAALIIIVVLLISCILRKMTGSRSNRVFLLLVLTVAASTVFDIAAVLERKRQYTRAICCPFRVFAHAFSDGAALSGLLYQSRRYMACAEKEHIAKGHDVLPNHNSGGAFPYQYAYGDLVFC